MSKQSFQRPFNKLTLEFYKCISFTLFIELYSTAIAGWVTAGSVFSIWSLKDWSKRFKYKSKCNPKSKGLQLDTRDGEYVLPILLVARKITIKFVHYLTTRRNHQSIVSYDLRNWGGKKQF